MQIRIQPAFLLYLACIALLSSWQSCLCALAALLLHEGGHYIVSRFTGESIAAMELTPFGGVMTYAPGNRPHKGLKGACVALSGPASNYLVLLLLTAEPVQSVLKPYLIREAFTANFCMCLLNLLPVLPLDGGRLVFCLGYSFFSVSSLIRLLATLGTVSGVMLIFTAFCGFMYLGKLNCSMLMIGAYLCIYAQRSYTAVLSENLYDIVSEMESSEPVGIRSMQLYRISPDVRMFELLKPLQQSKGAVFLYEDHEGQHVIFNSTIRRQLISAPSSTVKQMWAERKQECLKKRTES